MPIIKPTIRFIGYLVLVTAPVALLISGVGNFPPGLNFNIFLDASDRLGTSEFSPVEIVQNLILILCTVCFLLVARHNRILRPLSLGMAGLFVLFLIRELDYFFDRFVIDNLWQVLSVLLSSVVLVYLYRHRRRLSLGARRIWPSTGLVMIIGGLLLLLGFSQMVSQEALWQAILGDRYERVIRIAVEELTELGAYLLILAGSLEYLCVAWELPLPAEQRRRRRRRHRRQS